jgi:hydrogenase maturation factor
VNDERCITCGDIAVEMTIVHAGELGLCAADDGGRHSVDLTLVDEPAPGDRVLVHAGVALALLNR